MNEEIQRVLDALRAALIKNVSPETTSVSVFINSEGVTLEVKTTSASSLRERYISMRNIAGTFIK
jgi:hypothetical protein